MKLKHVLNSQLRLSNWLPKPDKPTVCVKTNSWFHIDFASGPHIDCKESTVQVPDYSSIYETNDLNTNGKMTTVTVIIQVVPDQNQSQVINQWFYQCLCLYNAVVDYIKNSIYKHYRFSAKGMLSKNIICQTIIGKYNIEYVNKMFRNYLNQIHNEYVNYKIDMNILDLVVKSAQEYCNRRIDTYNKYVQIWSKYYNQGNLRYPKLRFRYFTNSSKRLTIQIIPKLFLDKSFHNGFFQTMKFSQDVSNIGKLSKFQYDFVNRKYYLVCTRNILVRTKTHTLRRDVCGVDPGAREFLVVYSKSNEVYDACTGKDFDKIESLQCKINRIKTLMSSKPIDRITKITVRKSRKNNHKINKKNRKKKSSIKNPFYGTKSTKTTVKRTMEKHYGSTKSSAIFNHLKYIDSIGKNFADEKPQTIQTLLTRYPKFNLQKEFSIVKKILGSSCLANRILTINKSTSINTVKKIYESLIESGLKESLELACKEIGIATEYLNKTVQERFTNNIFYDYLVSIVIRTNDNQISRKTQLEDITNGFKNDHPKPVVKQVSVTKSIGSLRRALIKYETRIYNMVKDLHYKISLVACQEF